jgi:choline dehydrogenase-like flavoprotein
VPPPARGAATVPEHARRASRGALTLRPHALRREASLNCALFFEPRHAAHPAFAAPGVKAALELWDQLRGRAVPGGTRRRAARAARALDQVGLALARRLLVADAPAPRWRMRALFECAPDAANRVSLSDSQRDAFGRPLPRVEWRFGELDLRSVRRAHELLDASLRRSGLGQLELAFPDRPQAWRAAAEPGKHPMSATRLHADPRRGVADASGRVHGVAGLYLAGSSVFPTGGFANPTLTIVALAVRLARHLRERALA